MRVHFVHSEKKLIGFDSLKVEGDFCHHHNIAEQSR